MKKNSRMNSKKPNKKSKRNPQNRASTYPETPQLVFRPSIRSGNMPFPARFKTSMTVESDWKVAAATSSITNGYCYASNLYLPFYNSGGAVNTLPYTFLGPATASTLQYAGASSLLNSTMYQWFKILRSTIQVRFDPGPANADVEVVIVPSVNSALPSNIYSARQQPYAKTGKFSSSGNAQGLGSDGYLSHQLTTGQALGFSREEVKYDISDTLAIYGVGTPGAGFLWSIWLQTCDANVTVGAGLLRVRMIADVELNVRSAALPNT